MKAIILAGGKGTRLQPFTVCFPKPMLPLADTPIIEVLIGHLLRFGIVDITLTLGHMAPLLRSYFDNRPNLTSKINLCYVEEEFPMGTAGSLALVPDLNETFLVANGDLLTDLDIRSLIEYHKSHDAILTIATRKRNVKIDYGVLEFDDKDIINKYLEKPEINYHISMGIYVYEPAVLKYIDKNCYLDFPDLVLKLIDKGERVCSYHTDCLWYDIGRPDDYAMAQEYYMRKSNDHE
jgi:NDP-mannose synthase